MQVLVEKRFKSLIGSHLENASDESKAAALTYCVNELFTVRQRADLYDLLPLPRNRHY